MSDDAVVMSELNFETHIRRVALCVHVLVFQTLPESCATQTGLSCHITRTQGKLSTSDQYNMQYNRQYTYFVLMHAP